MLAGIARRAAMVLTAAITLVPLTTTDGVAVDRSLAVSCPANNFCVWEDRPSNSPMARFVNGTDDTGRAGLPYGGKTVRNRTQNDWCVWSKRDYGGEKTGDPSRRVRQPRRFRVLFAARDHVALRRLTARSVSSGIATIATWDRFAP
ncbi:peptidase inhibitor family I36 protein [Streptomyces sp. NPDC088551]|uniref:peptidase inhibitor family I36 protein n=1 Tax=Streptomyces sp. NPDC088551 TaxID=3365863 RepID=UPI003804453F